MTTRIAKDDPNYEAEMRKALQTVEGQAYYYKLKAPKCFRTNLDLQKFSTNFRRRFGESPCEHMYADLGVVPTA